MGETTKPTGKTRSTRKTPSPQEAPVDEVKTFIEAVPYGVAVYDTEGRVVRSNAAYRDTLARFIPKRPAATLRERVKQSPMCDTHGAPLSEDQWPHTRMLRGEGIVGSAAVEVMMYTADGEALYMNVTGAPLCAEDGRIIGAIAIHHDITAQKRLERELRQSRDELQAILEAVPDQVIVYDSNLHLARSNAAHRAAEHRYYPGEPAPGALSERIQRTQTIFRDLKGAPLPEGDWPQRRILRGETLSGSSAVETQATTHEGKAQWWSVSGAPLLAEDGTITGAVLVNTDVTQRKELEEALRRANERFAIAERAANGFVYEWDVRAGVIYRSAGFERLLGYRPGEIAPTWTAWAQLVYPGDWQVRTDADAIAFVQALRGETLESEYRVRHRDGHYLTVAEHALIERDDDGNVIRLIGQTQDITERKQMERLLAEQNHLLALIAAGCPLDDFLTALTSAVARLEPGARAAVLVADATQMRLQTISAAAIPPSFAEGLKDTPIDDRAIYSSQPITCADIAHDERWSHIWRDQCLAHGILACYSEPVIGSGGEQLASLMLCFDTPRTPSDWEMRIALVGARLLGIAIERRRAEAGIQRANVRFQLAEQAANGFVFEWDVRTGNVYRSEGLTRILGYHAEEIAPGWEGWTALIHPDDVLAETEAEALAYLQALPDDTLQNEYRVRHRDGHYVPVAEHLLIDRNERGEIVRLVGQTNDVTERKELEAELRASEERYRGIVETASEGVWLVDMLGRTVYANERMAALLGCQVAELTGRPITDFVFPEDVELAYSYLGSNLQGNIEQFDFRFRRRDGSAAFVLAGASPVRDATGEIVGALGMFSDITERLRLEYEVAERASLLEAVFAAAPDRITIFDETGQMIRLNPAAQQVAGPEREHASMETVGRLFDLRTVDGDPFPPEGLPTARALRGEIVQGVEIIERGAEQQDHYILTSSAPFYDLTGELRGAVALAHDVTELRRTEREAATWAAQLDATFDSLTDGLFIYDAAGRLARMNDAARTILALDAAPDYYSLTPEERTARMQVRDANDHPLAPEEWGLGSLAKGERLEEPVELRITALDGTTKDLAITGGPVRDRQGNMTGAVALLRDVTESRRLQRAVAEQASQLRATFDSLAEPMCVFDARGRILRQNEAERTMFGFDTPPATLEERAACIQLRSAEGLLLSPEEAPGRRVLAGETLVGGDMVEALAHGADGHDHWFSVTGAPIRSDVGKIIGGVIAYRDVTERRSLEREIEERAGLLQTTFDSMTDGVLILDVDGAVRACNDTYRTLMGYDPVTEERRLSADARRKRFRARDANGKPFSPESWPLTRVLRGETITHESAVDLHMRARDGRRIIVSVTGAPLRDSDGALIGALVVMRDVTTQRALQRETRWQASMLERAHDAIFMWELDGPILYWNHGAELLYGYSGEEAVGQISHQLLQTERPVSPELFKKALKRTGEWIGDIRHTTRDGRCLITESRHQLLKEPGGKAIVLEICRDITERLELEQELRRSHDELDQRVHERTRELASANRSLRRLSRQVMEVQETERRRIARELHDEIGQALTGVKMMIETAERRARTTGASNMERRNPALDVREAIDDALNRVRELSLDLRPAMLDSLGLLPTLLWRFENYMGQTGIQVEFHHTGLDQRFAPEVETGAYRIVQEALTNVARHAAVPIVRVQVIAADTMLQIYIIDEGAGFEADEAIAAGLSTGLAGMRERATLLGGVLHISSIPGAGTTIEVELPLSPGGEVESERDAARHSERDLERDAQRDAARDLARDVVRDAARDMARDAERDANRDQGEEGEP